VLARALEELLRGDPRRADSYTGDCLDRVWRRTHFSWWMTTMLHTTPGADPMDAELQLAQLRYVTTSRAAAASLAENYTGYPPPP
jgi:p-hydroxybenzoate 3-monooxygenase